MLVAIKLETASVFVIIAKIIFKINRQYVHLVERVRRVIEKTEMKKNMSNEFPLLMCFTAKTRSTFEWTLELV